MTPVDILLELQDLGVRVWVDDGALQFSAPLESLPDEVRAAIAEHETGLKAFVAQMSKSRRGWDTYGEPRTSSSV